MPPLSEAELAMLTPAEREAVLEDDDNANPKANDVDPDEEKDADEEGAEVSARDEAKPAEAAKPAADADAGKGADDAPASNAGDTDAADAAAEKAKDAVTVGKGFVQLDVGAERDFSGELADLRKKYEEGEVSQADYETALIDIGAARAAAQVTQQLNTKFAEQEWNQAQEDFYGANARFNSPAMRAALGNAVERIEAESGEQKLRSSVLLQKAAALVDQELGALFGQPAQPAKPAAKEVPTKSAAPNRTEEAARARAATAAPRTLADVPSAQENETGKNDKFEAIDRLEGLEFEEAIARLSPSEREAFEALQ